MTTYTEHEQRALDQEGGRALDRIASAPAILVGSVPLKPDAPVMLPTFEDLTALGDRIVGECNARLKRLGDPPMSSYAATALRHDIVGALIDVRHAAADYASDQTWKRANREVLR